MHDFNSVRRRLLAITVLLFTMQDQIRELIRETKRINQEIDIAEQQTNGDVNQE